MNNKVEFIESYIKIGNSDYQWQDNHGELVRCKDCKHRPIQTEPPETHGFSIEFPEGKKCPCCCVDGYYSWYPNDDWFCAEGEKR